MTRIEALNIKNVVHKIKEDNFTFIAFNEQSYYNIINKIYDSFEERGISLAVKNTLCEGCKHLEKKEKNLQFECLIEICRTCSRNNNDNFEKKDSE